MKQLTTEQAIEFAKSKVYESWTNEQIVRLQLFQKKSCINFSIFHEALSDVLNRPVFIHEFGTNYDGIIKEYLTNLMNGFTIKKPKLEINYK